MQSWSLDKKIQVTTARIIEWYEHYNGLVYVAFSGGKDSTVLLDLVRKIYPDVPAVFCDTGLEFPEVRQFAMNTENVVVLHPEMNFRKVIETYGYPIVSKRVADTVEYGHKPGSFRWKELHGEIVRSNGTKSEFNCEKWCYLLDAPFKVSSRCCNVMKKKPMKKYSKETGRVPLLLPWLTKADPGDLHGCQRDVMRSTRNLHPLSLCLFGLKTMCSSTSIPTMSLTPLYMATLYPVGGVDDDRRTPYRMCILCFRSTS